MYIPPYANGAVTATAVLAANLANGGTASLNCVILGNEVNSAQTYLQIFDAAAAAAVTLGTTAPNMIVDAPSYLGNVVNLSPAVVFRKGVVIAATTTATGSSAPSVAVSATLCFN